MTARTDSERRRPSSNPGSRPHDRGHAGTPNERIAQLHGRLNDLAVALSGTLDPEEAADRLLEAALGGLGAAHGWLGVLTPDGAAIDALRTVGYAPGQLLIWLHVALDLDTPVTDAIRTGRLIAHASAADRIRAYPAIVRMGGPAPGVEAMAVAPMTIEGRPIGTLAVTFDTVRELDTDERWFLAALAAQGAQALDRARLFAALRERDERLRFALAASGMGTWEWDIPRDRLAWSPEVHAIHGVPEDRVPGGIAEYLEGIHPEDRHRVREAIDRSLDADAPYELEFRVVRPDGTVRWTHGVGTVQRDAAGRPQRMLGTSRDVTERKLFELERDRLIEAERETARLRDAFIGIVSHELRTPITTIYGGTRVLARRWRDLEPDARDDILADVVEEADRLYRLAEDLLVLTRVERGTLEVGDEPVHLGRLAERVVASERPRWPDVTFETRVPPDLPSIQGEDTYVEQVLRNLLGNAAKYGGPGSTVTVSAAASEPHILLTVDDEGPGVDAAESDSLFDLFYRSPTTASSVSGAGIGLFVCRQLVGAMGGRVHAEPRPGGGARFVVALPRYADDELG